MLLFKKKCRIISRVFLFTKILLLCHYFLFSSFYFEVLAESYVNSIHVVGLLKKEYDQTSNLRSKSILKLKSLLQASKRSLKKHSSLENNNYSCQYSSIDNNNNIRLSYT